MHLSHPSMFRLEGPPRSFFGETHVVISVWKEASVWHAEHNILSKRPAEHLVQKQLSFDVINYPPELPAVDEAQMEGEALNQAEIDLRLELEHLAHVQGNDDLAYSPILLVRETITPVTLWVRSVYKHKFKDMANGTKSPKLKPYFMMVMSLSHLKSA
jgi:hypothetical protein